VPYVFEDEFNGPAGSAPDLSKWSYDLGRWTDNNELETYTNSRANSYLDGQGHLVIKATRNGRDSTYTSARLTTQGKFTRNHGDFEARIKFDLTQGTWPAWWMFGDDYGRVGRPRCGEIDMIEVYGQPGWSPDSTVHCAGVNGHDTTREVQVPGGVDAGWHTWHLRWDGKTGILQFSKDGKVYMTVGPGDLPYWPFGSPGHPGGPMFMIMNLAVGGHGGGKVPASFSSATMLIDYVRVWLTRETPRVRGAHRGGCFAGPCRRIQGHRSVRRSAAEHGAAGLGTVVAAACC
jgi:beta-glucanase (GH16 family)